MFRMDILPVSSRYRRNHYFTEDGDSSLPSNSDTGHVNPIRAQFLLFCYFSHCKLLSLTYTDSQLIQKGFIFQMFLGILGWVSEDFKLLYVSAQKKIGKRVNTSITAVELENIIHAATN